MVSAFAVIQGVLIGLLILFGAILLGLILYYIVTARKYNHRVILFDDHNYPLMYYARLVGHKASDLKYFELVRNKSIGEIFSKKKITFEKPDDKYIYRLSRDKLFLIGKYVNDLFIPMEPDKISDKLITEIRDLESARNWVSLRIKENTYRTKKDKQNIIQLVSLGIILLMFILGMVFIANMIGNVNEKSSKNMEQLSKLIDKQIQIEERLAQTLQYITQTQPVQQGEIPPELQSGGVINGMG